MRTFLITIFLFCTSCSVSVISDPKNPPSEKENQMIDEVLDDLEQRFADIDIEVDFRDIPIFVVDEPTRGGLDIAGLCRGSGRRIILDRRLFSLEEEEDKIAVLWSTLFHELGHCYFGRGHVETLVMAEESKIFHLKTDQDVPEEFKYVCTIESSIMFPSITMASSLMPIEAKSYYILEMARHYKRFDHFEFKNLSLRDLEFYTERDVLVDKGYKLNQDCY